jgi:transcriptional regulator with XRE-family HTH domain
MPETLATLDKLFAAEALKRELLKRAWSVEELAEKCGLGFDTLTVELTRSSGPNQTARWRIEAALDLVIPLWSDPFEINVRLHCVRAYGIDPRLISREALTSFCRRLGTRPKSRKVDALFESLLHHFAAKSRVIEEGKAKL